ncbi:LysR family transcriptional regulator [Frateuria defendens]|uniref:LysR family transcriptional regulator n=1 Tax=Frateuria defendens TaxID=2219559 RepID=UPI00066FCF4B|nr:LysR family transcriptional regulator [Frateuria defendens]
MFAFSRFSRYFLEVARLGSLRKAAEALHVSASAIDRQILLAEAQFETALFERLPTGLRLTSAGELLLDDLRRWQKEHARTVERFDELRGLRRGHVAIAVIDALSEGLVAQTIAEVGVEFPRLTFDLRVVDNQHVREQVSASEVDFGLLLDPVEHAALEVRVLVDIPLGVAMPVDHPLAGEARLTMSRIMGYRQVMPAAPLIVHERAKVLYARHHMEGAHSIACNDIRMMRSLIRHGAGIGILSLLDVATDLEEGRLAFVPLHGRHVKPLVLALCVAPRRQLSRAAQLVMQRVIQAVDGLAQG